MNLTEIRVRNFRSIETEQHLKVPGQTTIVGPNNSGKTNILKSIHTLFTGPTNKLGYNRDSDLTFGASKARTSIVATFDGDPNKDREIYEDLDELHNLQGTERTGNQITLSLYFTETNTPVYSFFPNTKRPKAANQAAQYSRTHIALLNKIISRFSVHYVPSAKRVDQIYSDLLTPFLRKNVATELANHLDKINQKLETAAETINTELEKAGLSGYRASFSLPDSSVEAMISGFDFIISDPKKTSIQEKGMGIQTTTLLAAFKWITRQENLEGKSVIWLLEEPESYLHPALAVQCSAILESLAEEATVIKTTHSMAFIPQNPSLLAGTTTENGKTEIKHFKNISEATSSIRQSLGVKFADFYNLDKMNVFVEGESDKEILLKVLSAIPDTEHPLKNVRSASFLEFGGVKQLSGFIKATYHLLHKEKPCVIVFDGDEAGDKERRELQGFFTNQKIPFEPNQNYVSVRSRFPIEGLFPDQWIIELKEQHPSWFRSFSVDAAGELEPFQIDDHRKKNLQNSLLERAQNETNLDWARKFIQVLQRIDTALGKLDKKIHAPQQIEPI